MAATWNVLVVDDAEDVHQITRLALKRKSWRGRQIALTHARSSKEARDLLASPDVGFHCALVDVVMESEHAGLELCDFIRSNIPRTLRIILRTGQPGAAPPQQVMNDYDIDHYLAKPEVTEDRLYATIRACCRSSEDIAVLVEVGAQLREFTLALQDPSATRDKLAIIMVDRLRFLEVKYSAKLTFVHDAGAVSPPSTAADSALGAPIVAAALVAAQKRGVSHMKLHPGPEFGLPPKSFLVPTTALVQADRTAARVGDRVLRWFKSLIEEPDRDRAMGLAVAFENELAEKAYTEFIQDLDLFVTNWRMAEGTLGLQERLARERLALLNLPTGN